MSTSQRVNVQLVPSIYVPLTVQFPSNVTAAGNVEGYVLHFDNFSCLDIQIGFPVEGYELVIPQKSTGYEHTIVYGEVSFTVTNLNFVNGVMQSLLNVIYYNPTEPSPGHFPQQTKLTEFCDVTNANSYNFVAAGGKSYFALSIINPIPIGSTAAVYLRSLTITPSPTTPAVPWSEWIIAGCTFTTPTTPNQIINLYQGLLISDTGTPLSGSPLVLSSPQPLVASFITVAGETEIGFFLESVSAQAYPVQVDVSTGATVEVITFTK